MGLSASATLELNNSDEIRRTESASFQMAQKIRDERGIRIERQDSFKEHMVADIEQLHLLMDVAAMHATTDSACEQILDDVRESGRSIECFVVDSPPLWSRSA